MKKQPIKDTDSDRRDLRGGNWDFKAEVTRVSYRGRNDPFNRDYYQGFRIVRNKDTKR